MSLDIETLLMFVTVTFNTFLGTVIFIHGARKKSDISYVVLILMLVMWTLSVLGIRLSHEFESALFFLALSYASGLGIAISFWYFVETFIGRVVSYDKLVLVSIPAIMIGFLAFTSSKFIFSINNLDSLNKDFVFGPYHLLFVFYFSLLMIYAFYQLYVVYKKPPNAILASSVASVFVGTFLSTAIGATFDIYYLVVGVSGYIAWGPISTIVMVVFIAYAIMKYNLMSIKLISSEIFVVALLLTLAVRLSVSRTPIELLINITSLAISLCVGIFLIRSVYEEVRQREQIEKLADDLSRANQGQTNLIHVMNHQIKGRFGNAKNIFAELLTDDYGEMPDISKSLLQKGLEETTLGVDYVQNILRGASAEIGTLPYDMNPMNMKDIVETEFNRQKESAEKKELSINLHIKDGDYSMKGDRTQLSESVRNLIDNSINYTKQGSIDVSLSVDNMIRLSIKDTGVGLSSEDKPKLFKSGGRGADSLKINVNSTGYGLAFVKGVIEAHKGRVWAESEGCGKGSTFFVELPKS